MRRTHLIDPDHRDSGLLPFKAAPLFVFLMCALLLSGGYYVYTVNVAAVAGYRLRALEQEVVRMKDENARLRIAEAEARSYARIEAEKEALSLVEAGDVRYYSDTETLARR